MSRSATLESGRRLSGTRALARDLGVTYVVNGGVQRADNRIRVTLNLVRPDDSVAWGGSSRAPFDEFFDMQRRIAEDLSEALQVTLTRAARERLARPPAASVDAYADYSQARALLERPDVPGNVERAIEGFESALAQGPAVRARPRRPRARRIGRGTWRRRTRPGPARAQASITEALRLDPDQPRTRFALALAYQGTGRADAAIDELRRVLAQQPANDDAHRLLGDILADRGEWAEAIAELKRAVAIRPDYWRNHARWAGAYMKTGRYAEAIAAYTRITELQPDNSRGFQMLGFAYQNAGDNRRALENYRRAIEIAPDALAYRTWGPIYYDEGRFREAATAYEEAIRLGPGNPVTHRNLGDAYERLGESARARQAWRKAVELSEEALRVNPEDAQVLSRSPCTRPSSAARRGGGVHRPRGGPEPGRRRRRLPQGRGPRAGRPAGRRRWPRSAQALARGYSASRARVDYDLRTLGAASRVPGARRPGAVRRAAERKSLMRRATAGRRCWRGPAWPGELRARPGAHQPPAARNTAWPSSSGRWPAVAGPRRYPALAFVTSRQTVTWEVDQPGPRRLQAGGRAHRRQAARRRRARGARHVRAVPSRTARFKPGPGREAGDLVGPRPAPGPLPVQRHDRRRNRRSRAGGLALVAPRIALLLAAALAAGRAAAQPAPAPTPSPFDADAHYELGPDSKPRDGVAKGEVRGPFTLPSQAYPGTQHTWWVYVPAQYDRAVPASLMVFNDGQAFMNMEGDLAGAERARQPDRPS